MGGIPSPDIKFMQEDRFLGYSILEVKNMSYVDPKMKKHMDSLSPELQEAVLAKGIPIKTLQDLIIVLEEITEQP
jgi:hypothetical protein